MKYQAALRRLRARLPKNNQKGFTLIELLVVISILGILAAIVTMSLVGITAVATTRAASTELNTVQIAYDTMLADMRVDSAVACAGVVNTPATATNNMKTFPSNLKWSAEPNSTNRVSSSSSTRITSGKPRRTGPTTARIPSTALER